SHWYFSRATGMLVGYDTFREDDVDACEIRFEGQAEWNGRRLPELFVVRSGDREFGRFRMTSSTFGPPTPDTPEKKPEDKTEAKPEEKSEAKSDLKPESK